MTIVVDTNFLFALKAEKDKNRFRAIEILKDINIKKEDVITNYLVISEIFTLAISRSLGDKSLMTKIHDLIFGDESFLKIYSFSMDDYQMIYEILIKYCTPKRLLSYVDASLIYLYEKKKANYVLSFDSHFDNITNRLF
ncbi:MAG: PIN domain-containing protein [Promethearchaeota archaeon]|nr:MAG: PIN domain-containing protein [Candidatus Lokiarchaeota archaeon]